jgi:hypothetical protein
VSLTRLENYCVVYLATLESRDVICANYADVQGLVRDETRFPTPVNPVGSIMSVSSTFVNDGGTMVCLRKLDEVIGVERDAAGREGVFWGCHFRVRLIADISGG